MLHTMNLDDKTQRMVESLTTAILYTLPSILNILAMMLLIMFIFAVVGMNLFGEGVPTESEYHFYGDFWAGYGKNMNFKYFGTSFLTLMIIFTGEGLVAFMRDIMKFYPSVRTRVPLACALRGSCAYRLTDTAPATDSDS